MKLHERVLIVQGARNGLESALLDLAQKHDLTLIEQVCILNEVTSGVLKYALRFERHGDYETPSGLEGDRAQARRRG